MSDARGDAELVRSYLREQQQYDHDRTDGLSSDATEPLAALGRLVGRVEALEGALRELLARTDAYLDCNEPVDDFVAALMAARAVLGETSEGARE